MLTRCCIQVKYIKHKLLISNLYILFSGCIGKFIFSDKRKKYQSNNPCAQEFRLITKQILI